MMYYKVGHSLIHPQTHAVNRVTCFVTVSQMVAKPSNNICVLAVNLLNGLPLQVLVNWAVVE